MPHYLFIEGVFKLKNETDYNTFLYHVQKNEQNQLNNRKLFLDEGSESPTGEDAAQT